jgi:uncharacterized heparinase superfamily protein
MSADGSRLAGLEQFARRAASDELPLTLRFHLHPAVAARLEDASTSVILSARHGHTWRFSAEGLPIYLDESVFLGGADGARRSTQIVIAAGMADKAEIAWRFDRLSAPVRTMPADSDPEPADAEYL